MDANQNANTPTVGASLFKVDIVHSNLVHIRARGDFDRDGLTSIRTELNRSPVFLNPDRLVIVEFVESCEGSNAFFEGLSAEAYRMVEMGFAAKQVAFVASPDIKGYPDTLEKYKKAYANVGISTAFFKTVAPARSWLLARANLEAHGSLGLPPPHCELTTFESDRDHPHMIRINCQAPFDLVFLESAIELQGSDIRFLNPNRVELIHFIGDCKSATEGFYESWADHIIKELTMGFAPKSIAIVVGESENGRSYFLGRLLDLFEEHASYSVKDFTNITAAQDWLLGQSL